jgi:Ca2+-transporting ATPase
MIIDPACSIIFEAEPEESNVMDRAPKSIDEPFFGKGKILMSCVQGLFILAAIMGVYFFCIHSGYPENKIRSMSFVSLIVANIATILSNRTWTGSIFKSLTHPTPPVKWVLGGAVVFLTIVLNTPFFLNVFRFEKISLVEGIFCIIAGLTSIIWFECYKVIKFRR